MGRFDNLKSSNEKNKDSNPFKKGGRRKEKNEKIRDFSKMKGTMPLPGLNNDSSENKSGKYVAPGLRNKYRSRNNTPKEKPVFKTEDKFREKEGDFPELGSVNFPELQVKKENKKEVNEKVDEEKSSKWSNIVSEKEDDEKETNKHTKHEFKKLLKKCEPVRPGWVRLSLDKETRKVTYEYGPETKEHLEFMARMERSRLEQARKAWDTRMREIEEFNEMMYPEDNYIYSWEYDDHVHHQEWLRKLEEDDYGEPFYESEGSDEYYSDEY
jgi:hypothetical protein